MSSTSAEQVDLLDLRMLPAWVNEPSQAKSYEHYEGEEGNRGAERDRRPHARDRDRRPPRSKPPRKLGEKTERDRRPSRGRPQDRQSSEHPHRPREDRQPSQPRSLPKADVRFVPHPPALESVIAQIESGHFAYSMFALARLFLEKPERYDVQLTAKAEEPLFQLGENGALAADKQFLENSAFRLATEDFYKIDTIQNEPIKGNFTNVARCRLSGTLLGPTNYHSYQPQLRSLFEQRFSRRMSFAEYQKQIEIVSDPAVVEKWKEEVRNVTTFTVAREEAPQTFNSATEAERHFRQNYLPGLVRPVVSATVDGVISRRLHDRALNHLVEDAWSNETRSPSRMMQELSGKLRESGLHIFRHRRGMLFVSSVRPRAFAHEEMSVSPSVKSILVTLAEAPGLNRKTLAEKLIPNGTRDAEASAGDTPAATEATAPTVDVTAGPADQRKLALASDLKWLTSEGYVIEFNDGSLDLPRVKSKAQEVVAAPTSTEVVDQEREAAIDSKAESARGSDEPPLPSAESSSPTEPVPPA